MRTLHPSAVPATMIEKATERRLAGDWPGACAAAGVVVHVDLATMRRHFGTEVAGALEADLRHLVPDLLRWHFPRDRNGFPRTDAFYPLALLPDDHGLFARARPGEHRIDLRIDRLVEQPGRRDDTFVLLRDRWDSRCTAEILARSGGVTRLPFFTAAGARHATEDGSPEGRVESALGLDERGRHAAAWAVAGYDLQVLLFDRRFGRDRLDPAAFAIDPAERNRARGAAVERSLAWPRPVHATLREAARRTLAYVRELRAAAPWPRPGVVGPSPHPMTEVNDHLGLVRIDVRGRTIVLDGARARLLTRGPYHETDASRRDAELDEFGTTIERIPVVPPVLVRRPEELDALLRGPARLHPLVHRALFPEAPAAVPPEPARLRTTLRVQCDHATHEITMRAGEIVVPHTSAEIDRELALSALGGALQGCVAAREGWRAADIRPPRPVRHLQVELLHVIRHGDTAAVLDALARGLDPHVRLPAHGETLLHRLPLLPGGEGLLPALLTAGLDPNARDRRARTPLHEAVARGSEHLVRALLKAGADPKARSHPSGYVNMAGFTGRKDLAFLRPLLQ
ncbi:hypothetical protein [Dactylosporangium sp. NPDC049140]|uniref:hypothetical protein n=1 Tax=Dactylosporangium sp. NPDC049140 TaxID=3155647 RepID=UPI0033E2ECC3